MKYVIEINDHAMNDSCTPALYRAKGFKTLVFDEYGLSKLTPFDEIHKKAWNEGYQVGTLCSEQKSYDNGYKHGYDEGKEAMKEIVMKNLTKFVDGSKFKPEVAIFDACDDCRYAHKTEYEIPCADCKHSHKDYYERGQA